MKNHNQYIYKKPIMKLSMGTLALGSLLAIAGCNNSLVNNQLIKATADKPIVSKIETTSTTKADKSYTAADDSASTPEGVKQVVDANNQFAIDMYQQINGQTEQAHDNVFFSPYSLSTAMAMLYAAAEGKTKAQIQKTFHYPSLSVLNPNSAALHEQFNKPNPNYQLATANDLWIQQGLRPNQNYLGTVQRYYGGNVTNLDFKNSPEPSRQTINKTIAKHTKQMIPELLAKDSIKPSTAAVLTNAVHFKSEWAQPLALRNWEQPFYNLDGTTTDVNLMYGINHFDYMEDEKVQVVELPYKGDDLSMLIVLPKSKEPVAIQKLVANLSTTQINQWTEQLENRKVFLIIPKFKLQESYQMESLLTKMGMPSVFGNQAKFNVFADSSPIAIDDIHHQAVIDVNEKGTVAAAATSIVIKPISASYNAEFTADHPSMFMIKDNKTDVILFLGQVNKL
ncbi:serpin family protein [Psychrobacter urativorans]|uniref:Serine protease inhibitor n=1 Tax=Psychrobacter urativorans TaxID=45610 RepID=A0A0M4T0X5_9GAMM|nr:serpin family protein [Psychrobacter urativorans]ALF58865.1 serine protease inhibitor [Psychrobacter urativorans]